MSDERLHRLKVAFAYDVARKIMTADRLVAATEAEWLRKCFPWESLEAQGFTSPDGSFNDLFEDAALVARAVLPAELSMPEKLDLVTLFVQAAVADDWLDRAEGAAILEAANLLGISNQQFLAHLDTLRLVGEVDVPEPENP